MTDYVRFVSNIIIISLIIIISTSPVQANIVFFRDSDVVRSYIFVYIILIQYAAGATILYIRSQYSSRVERPTGAASVQ